MSETVADKRKAKLGSISSMLSKVDNVGKTAPASGDGIAEIGVDKLSPGKYQPRREFDEVALNELADSIKAHGVMQPIVIRPIGEDAFEIVAGERRWRAAKIAGLEAIPAITKDIDDQTAIAMALIENIQREDLSYLEEAQALQRLKDEFSLKSKEVAEAVGKREKEVSELLGLLKLPEPLKALLERGTVSPQILAVLNRCYKLDAEATENFVANKSVVTYDEATAFQKYLKEPKTDEEGAETEQSQAGDPEAETEDSDQDTATTTERNEEPGELDLGSSEGDEQGFIVDNKNFIVAVELDGEEWTLDLTRKDNEAEYCWIKRGSDIQRVLARNLIVLAVQ